MKLHTNHSKTTSKTERFEKRKSGDFIFIYDNKNKKYIPKEFYAPSGGEIGCNIFLRKLKENSKLAYNTNKKRNGKF
jgi:hypothetical protein